MGLQLWVAQPALRRQRVSVSLRQVDRVADAGRRYTETSLSETSYSVKKEALGGVVDDQQPSHRAMRFETQNARSGLVTMEC